jgi:hypothetical protein
MTTLIVSDGDHALQNAIKIAKAKKHLEQERKFRTRWHLKFCFEPSVTVNDIADMLERAGMTMTLRGGEYRVGYVDKGEQA